jgi:hypothetical protein
MTKRPVRTLELVGLSEVGVILGVSRGHARNMRRWKQLPEPSADLACGPVWHRGDFERWAAERKAK